MNKISKSKSISTFAQSQVPNIPQISLSQQEIKVIDRSNLSS